MATWDPPSDTDLGVGKPGKPSHARRIRDDVTALAERASGSPWVNAKGAFVVPWAVGPLWEGALEVTWTVPLGVTRVEAFLLGGGGCGGRGDNVSGPAGARPGGGGGAGAHITVVIRSTPGDQWVIHLGAGGHPTLIHPSVDTNLSSWSIGDGALTYILGPDFLIGAYGGGRGQDGQTGDAGGAAGGHGGGAGPVGGQLYPLTKMRHIQGAQGGRAFRAVGASSTSDGPVIAGAGAASVLGGGGAGITRETITAALPGPAARVHGAGGCGSIPGPFVIGNPSQVDGGRGGNGIVWLRY